MDIGTCNRCTLRHEKCADDMANSEAELQPAVIEWASVSGERGMEIDASKGKIMHSRKRIQRKLNIEWEGERKKWRTLNTWAQ